MLMCSTENGEDTRLKSDDVAPSLRFVVLTELVLHSLKDYNPAIANSLDAMKASRCILRDWLHMSSSAARLEM